MSIRTPKNIVAAAALVVAALSIGFANNASAIVVDYKIANGSVSSYSSTSGGLAIETNILSSFADTEFSLNDFTSYFQDPDEYWIAIPFFKVNTPEQSNNGGTDGDYNPQSIDVTVNFSSPQIFGVDLPGTSIAVSGDSDDGMITWHGDGGAGHPEGVVEIFTDVSRIWVWLSDQSGLSFDNTVRFDPDHNDKKVYLHIKQKASWPGNTSSVPAPAALPAGIALMGLVIARRKRRA